MPALMTDAQRTDLIQKSGADRLFVQLYTANRIREEKTGNVYCPKEQPACIIDYPATEDEPANTVAQGAVFTPAPGLEGLDRPRRQTQGCADREHDTV